MRKNIFTPCFLVSNVDRPLLPWPCYPEKALLLGMDGRIISEFKWQRIFLELKYPLS